MLFQLGSIALVINIHILHMGKGMFYDCVFYKVYLCMDHLFSLLHAFIILLLLNSSFLRITVFNVLYLIGLLQDWKRFSIW